MNAKDLMVGDWVLDTYTNKPMRIEGINGGNPRFGQGLKPIPLTPEILEKNGFNYEETHDVWILEYGEIIIEVGAYHPDFINISYKQMTPDGIIEGDISSISKFDGSDIMTHELQHALRLCGIEKEIEL